MRNLYTRELAIEGKTCESHNFDLRFTRTSVSSILYLLFPSSYQLAAFSTLKARERLAWETSKQAPRDTNAIEGNRGIVKNSYMHRPKESPAFSRILLLIKNVGVLYSASSRENERAKWRLR